MGRKIVVLVVAIAFMASSVGCASIFYPSRVGQQTHGSVDVGMLVLDILLTGLIGVVVDLITGAIYWPGPYCVPSDEIGLSFNPDDGYTRVSSITMPRAGEGKFSLPVRAAKGTRHEVVLTVQTSEGLTVASAKSLFMGNSTWQQISSKFDISAGKAKTGVMLVAIDGVLKTKLPVKFDE